jgi:hypothetical protein
LTVNRKIPVSFQKLDNFDIQTDDTRFLPVKIWLMHLGENFNGSYFSKDVVENAIWSLANTPILAYMEENSEGEMDFSDHRQSLVIKDGSFDIEYECEAIGLIPETNNAKFEDKLCEDGVTRTFLTVEGLIWKKWDDPVDILNRELSSNQSMELHSDYEGTTNQEDGLFHFTNFKFFGACALGIDYSPAMINSTIETNFSLDKFQKVIQEKMEEFKVALSLQEGGTNIVEEPILENEVIEEAPQEQPEVSEPVVEEVPVEVVEQTPVEEVVETKVEEVVEEPVVEPVVEFDYKSEYEKLKVEFETISEKLAKLQVEYSKLEETKSELEQFKMAVDAKERETAETSLFATFAGKLTEDEMQPIKDKKSEFSLEELEEKLFALAGRKSVVFNKVPVEDKPIRYNLPVDNKQSNKPEWADLVEQHKNK